MLPPAANARSTLTPPRPAPTPPRPQVFSLLALALWIVTSVKSFLMSSLLAVHNLQSLLGAAASEPPPSVVLPSHRMRG